MQLIENIANAIDKKEYIAGVFLNFKKKKAFDTIDYWINWKDMVF